MEQQETDFDATWSQVMEALARLGPDWTVLSAPRFGLEQTDAVVVHETHGVVVLAVSTLCPGMAERDPDGHLVSPVDGGRLAHQPHIDADRIADHLHDAYYADIDGPKDSDGSVRWLVVAPHLDDETAQRLHAPEGVTDAEAAVAVRGSSFQHDPESALIRPPSADPSLGVEQISRAGLARVLEGAVLPSGTGVPVADMPNPAPVSAAAQALVAEPTGSRLRRVRGPGGTGKTFALTMRAAALAASGQRVLVLSFTTTLAGQLTELIRRRCAELGADPRLVTITNFHALCEHTVLVAESIGYRSEWPAGARWPVAIVERARQVISQGFDLRFGAILIDEGQDFDVEWWQMLADHFLMPGGEALITVDPTEDLYRVEPWFDDAQMTELGFTDPWVELTTSVRTPPDVVPALAVVGDRPSVVHGSPERESLLGPAAPTVRRWVDIDRVAALGREIGREVVRLVRDHPSLAPDDVVFVCDYHHDGLAAVREIERAGIPVHHQFSRDPAGRGVRRRRFHVGAPAVKGSTVHGFKGWEAGALVMGIGADATSPALARIAIERLATPVGGGSAIITIVNGDRRLRADAASLGWNDPAAKAQVGAPPPAAAAPPTPTPAAEPPAPAVSDAMPAAPVAAAPTPPAPVSAAPTPPAPTPPAPVATAPTPPAPSPPAPVAASPMPPAPTVAAPTPPAPVAAAPTPVAPMTAPPAPSALEAPIPPVPAPLPPADPPTPSAPSAVAPATPLPPAPPLPAAQPAAIGSAPAPSAPPVAAPTTTPSPVPPPPMPSLGAAPTLLASTDAPPPPSPPAMAPPGAQVSTPAAGSTAPIPPPPPPATMPLSSPDTSPDTSFAAARPD